MDLIPKDKPKKAAFFLQSKEKSREDKLWDVLADLNSRCKDIMNQSPPSHSPSPELEAYYNIRRIIMDKYEEIEREDYEKKEENEKKLEERRRKEQEELEEKQRKKVS